MSCITIAAFLYISTLAPSITWANMGSDSGELVAAAYHLGVAHPTGYPLFVVIGWLFAQLPFGSVAYRINLMSAVASTAAIAVLCLLLWDSLRQRSSLARSMGVALGALFLAVSPLFWSQAVIAEVYALHALLVLLAVWSQERMIRTLPALAPIALAGLIVGVGAANHVTLLLVAPGMLVRLFLASRLSGRHRYLREALFVGGVLTGLSFYLLLIPLAATAPPYATWGATETLAGWWAHVTGAAYRGAAFSLPLNVVLTRLPALARLLLEQFGWVGYGLMLLGWWSLWREAKGLAASLSISAVLFLVFALNYPVLNSQVYLLGFFVLMAPALAWGVAYLVQEAAQAVASPRWTTIGVVLASMVLLGSGYVNAKPKVDVSQDRTAYRFAQETLNALPQDALLFTRDDGQTFSLWYLQHVEGYREDVVVVDTRLLTWPWYQQDLALTYPEATFPCIHCFPLREAQALILANASIKEAYATFPELGLPTTPEGALYRYAP